MTDFSVVVMMMIMRRRRRRRRRRMTQLKREINYTPWERRVILPV
jgi:hypothetical protein